jgi:hypothetical protein
MHCTLPFIRRKVTAASQSIKVNLSNLCRNEVDALGRQHTSTKFGTRLDTEKSQIIVFLLAGYFVPDFGRRVFRSSQVDILRLCAGCDGGVRHLPGHLAPTPRQCPAHCRGEETRQRGVAARLRDPDPGTRFTMSLRAASDACKVAVKAAEQDLLEPRMSPEGPQLRVGARLGRGGLQACSSFSQSWWAPYSWGVHFFETGCAPVYVTRCSYVHMEIVSCVCQELQERPSLAGICPPVLLRWSCFLCSAARCPRCRSCTGWSPAWWRPPRSSPAWASRWAWTSWRRQVRAVGGTWPCTRSWVPWKRTSKGERLCRLMCRLALYSVRFSLMGFRAV